MALTKKRDIDRLKKSTVNTDVRTLGQRIYDSSEEKGLVTFIMIAFLAGTLIFPAVIILTSIFIYALYLVVANNKNVINLPYRVPLLEKGKIKDYSTGSAKDPSAEFPIGEDYTTGKSLFCTLGDICTHLLCIGTTGAGKTVTLFSRTWATLAFGGGFIYQDAKAQADIFQKGIYLCLDFCRIHDLTVCNYGQKMGDGTIEKMGDGEVQSIAIMSNTLNPVFTGTEADLAEYFIMQLPPAGDNNQVFLDRGIMLAKAIAPALINLRDQRVLTITPAVVRHFMRVEAIADDRHGLLGKKGKFRPKLAKKTISILTDYLKDLNYDFTKPFNQQDEEVGKQHGYGTSYFNNALYTMSVEFEHICESRVPDAHFSDIIRYKRCYIGLIPAIGLSAEAKKSIGKMGMSGIRSALKECLAQFPEGDAAEVIDALPVNPKIPLTMVLDEFSEQAVKDCAPIFTQARSMGVAACIGNQDLGGIERGIGKEETFMIFGSTRQKFLMSCEDPEYTIPKFQGLLAQEIVAKQSQFVEDKESGDDTGRRQSRGVNIEKEDVITVSEIQSQGPGESAFFLKGEFFKGRTFYHNISDDEFEKVRTIRIQRGISGIPLTEPNVRKLENRAKLRYSTLMNERGLSGDLDVLSSIKEFVPNRGSDFPWVDYISKKAGETDDFLAGMLDEKGGTQFKSVAKAKPAEAKRVGKKPVSNPKPKVASVVETVVTKPGQKPVAAPKPKATSGSKVAPVKPLEAIKKTENPAQKKNAQTSTRKPVSNQQKASPERPVASSAPKSMSGSVSQQSKPSGSAPAATVQVSTEAKTDPKSPTVKTKGQATVLESKAEAKAVNISGSSAPAAADEASQTEVRKMPTKKSTATSNVLAERRRGRMLKNYQRSISFHRKMGDAVNALAFLDEDTQQSVFSTADEIISVIDRELNEEKLSQQDRSDAVVRFMNSLMEIKYPSVEINTHYRDNIVTMEDDSSKIKATLSAKNRRVKSAL